MGDDRPQTDESRLWEDLRELSVRLVETIPLVHPTCPILVNGEWGTGKSSLLQVTEGKLRKQGYPTVWFGAWYHEGEGNLLPLLLRAVWKATPSGFRKRWLSRQRWKRLWRAGIAVSKKTPELLAETLAVVGSASWGILTPVLSLAGKGDADPSQADATEEVWLGFRRMLRDAFHGRKPVIIFIDDLDRCRPAAAVALVDSLRLLLGTLDRRGPGRDGLPNCRFVVALDRAVLAHAVAVKFSGFVGYDASRYLEKIFPISFQLPQPKDEAILDFVESFAGEKPQERDDRDEMDILGLALAEPDFANPRLMKRCIERFRMVMKFERKLRDEKREQGTNGASGAPRESEEEEHYKKLALAKWIVASEHWPILRQLLARRGDEYWRKIHQALQEEKDSDLPPEDARILSENPDLKLWLRRELLGSKGTRLKEFRDADARLRARGL